MRYLSLASDTRGQEKPVILGERFEWPHLWSPPEGLEQLPRFTLFIAGSAKWSSPENDNILVTGMCLDFDGHGLEEAEVLINAFDGAVPVDYQFYAVYSGGGYHVYIPFAEPITGLVWRQCLISYKKFCEEVERATGWTIDVQIPAIKYGRVPGQINRKRHKKARFIYKNDKNMAYFDELLEPIVESAPPKIYREPPKINQESQVYLEQCSYLQELIERKDEIHYDEFKAIMKMLSQAGLRDLAMHVFSGGKYPDEKIEGWFNSVYKGTCGDAANADKVRRKCLQCPHYANGNGSISAITGSRPTPNHPTYISWEKKPIFHSDEFIKGFFNVCVERNKDFLIQDVQTFYIYSDGTYSRQVPLSGGKNITRMPLSVRKLLMEWHVQYGGEEFTTLLWRDRIAKEFWAATEYPAIPDNYFHKNPRHIVFSNGVYNPEKGELEEASKDCPILQPGEKIIYNPKASSRPIVSWLKHVVEDDDSIELLQIFAGMAFTATPSNEMQEFLFVGGVPDSGKSAFARMIIACLGSKMAYSLRAKDIAAVAKMDDLEFELADRRLAFSEEFTIEGRRGVELWTKFVTTIFSGSPITTRAKFYKAQTYVPVCTLICTGNYEPEYGAFSAGLARRLRYVNFKRTVREKDKRMIRDFFDNRKEATVEGFIFWALEGLKKACALYTENGSFTPPKTEQEKIVATATEEQHEDYADRSTDMEIAANNWLMEHVVFDITATGQGLREIYVRMKRELKVNQRQFQYKRFRAIFEQYLVNRKWGKAKIKRADNKLKVTCLSILK